MGMPSHQKSQLWKEFSSAGSLVAGGETATFPGALIQNWGYAERVDRTLALLFRLWEAVKDSVFFLTFLVIFIAFVRVIFWIHNNIPFLRHLLATCHWLLGGCGCEVLPLAMDSRFSRE
ncbi:MAG: hypothetical protein OXI08_02870 [Cyanobacteria bacterium MAG IRC4_bin_6]|nr:hypothetical protein [Cyanobacteria bacterium MAG IRC4_bin_6]